MPRSRRSRISRRSRRVSRRSTRRSRSSRRIKGGAAETKKVRPSFDVGQTVRWNWGGNFAYGVVIKIHYEDTELDVEGKTIKMRGSPTKPVYEVKQESGQHLLKSALQLNKSTKKLNV